jgi:FixJ family two-component response regulator
MTDENMKAWAVEFLTRPFSDQRLLDAIRQALQPDLEALAYRKQSTALIAHVARARRDPAGRQRIDSARTGASIRRSAMPALLP